MELKKAKERSPNFPYISLEQALDRAKQFYDQEKRGSAPFAVAAEHWRYSPSSSGALQTVAALKSYGLMADEGSGDSRKVRLTELALRILLDMRPDSQERNEFKRQAALSPPVIAEIYQKWGTDLPSDANLHHWLVLERGFNAVTASKAVEILKKNQEFTSWQATGVLSLPDKMELEGQSAVSIVPQAGAMALHGTTVRIEGPGAVRNERIIGPTGDIQLTFFGEPTWEAYDFIEKYLHLRKGLLKPATPNAPPKEAKAEAQTEQQAAAPGE